MEYQKIKGINSEKRSYKKMEQQETINYLGDNS